MTNTKGPWPDALKLGDVEGYDPHFLAGYLYATIKRGESIDVAAWNEALLAARDFARDEAAKEAARAETAKRNAIAARRRGAGA